MQTVQILAPESLRHQANHLAAAKGLSVADLKTFGEVTHTRDGQAFIVVGVQVSDSWLSGMAQAVARPEWDTTGIVDIPAAESALAGLTIVSSVPEEPLPIPSGIAVMVGASIAAAFGLYRTE